MNEKLIEEIKLLTEMIEQGTDASLYQEDAFRLADQAAKAYDQGYQDIIEPVQQMVMTLWEKCTPEEKIALVDAGFVEVKEDDSNA